MIDLEKPAQEFQEKFGPFTATQQREAMKEEATELVIAVLQGDRVKIARECADLLIAGAGLSDEAAQDLQQMWNDKDFTTWWADSECCQYILRDIREHHTLTPPRWALVIASNHGLPLEALLTEVHAANMRKERGPPNIGFFGDHRDLSEPQDYSKPTKPPGWIGPDIAGVLGAIKECGHERTRSHHTYWRCLDCGAEGEDREPVKAAIARDKCPEAEQ